MSTGKFHISADGNVRACRAASEDACKAQGLGGTHFESREAGREAVEKILGGASAAPLKKPRTRTAKTPLEKTRRAYNELEAERAKIQDVLQKRQKDFTRVEKEILSSALEGKNSAALTVEKYGVLKAEIDVLDKELQTVTKKTRTAEAEYSKERKKTEKPLPYYSGGVCGGGRGC